MAKFVKYSQEGPGEVQRVLKEEYGVEYSLSKIHKIRRGETWRNV